MSVQSEITRISGNVTSALAAITAKGGNVPTGAISDDLAAAIATIPAGLTGLEHHKINIQSDGTRDTYTTILDNNDFLTTHYDDPNLMAAIFRAGTNISKSRSYFYCWVGNKNYDFSSTSLYGTYSWANSNAGGVSHNYRNSSKLCVSPTTYSTAGLFVPEAGKLIIVNNSTVLVESGYYDVFVWLAGGVS